MIKHKNTLIINIPKGSKRAKQFHFQPNHVLHVIGKLQETKNDTDRNRNKES